MQMQNLQRKYPQVLEKARCRCNYTWQKGWKASASSKKSKLQILWSKKEHLQQWTSRQCRYIGCHKSICNSEYQGSADTSVVKKASATANNKVVQIHHEARKDYAIQRIGVGLARRSWAGEHSLFFLGGRRELNSKKFTVIIKTDLQFIGENVSESIYKR